MVQRLRVAGVRVGMIVCLIFAPVATNLITASMVAASLGAVILVAQPADTAAAHRAAAKAAAGQDFGRPTSATSSAMPQTFQVAK